MLLLYNLIEQRVDTPIICHGFSLFDEGVTLDGVGGNDFAVYQIV